MLAAQLASVGPLDKKIMAMNEAAPPVTAGTHEAFGYGSGSGDSLGRAAFGFGGGVFDLGRRAFGR